MLKISFVIFIDLFLHAHIAGSNRQNHIVINTRQGMYISRFRISLKLGENCTLKMRGIGNWIPESATGPLLIRKRNRPLQNGVFGCLSGMDFFL